MCEVLKVNVNVNVNGYKAWRGSGSPRSTRPSDMQATAVARDLQNSAIIANIESRHCSREFIALLECLHTH